MNGAANPNLHGTDVWCRGSGCRSLNIYSGSKSEWLILANAYVDLGTWWNITPFVGAGVGMSRNTISGFTDLGPQQASVAFGDTASEVEFRLGRPCGSGLSGDAVDDD